MGLFSKSPEKIAKEAFRAGMKAYQAKDYAAALPQFEQAAEQGLADAQFNCGLMYYKGEGTARNLEKAMAWAKRAEEQGAQNADKLIEAIRAEQSKADAARMEQQKPASPPAAELTPDEHYEQGMELYRAGKYDEALPHLKKICPALSNKGKKQFPDARAALGWMYENGKGVEASESHARMQYGRGGRSGNQSAMEGYIRLVAANKELPISGYREALEWARELLASGNQYIAEYIPLLEQRCVSAAEQEEQKAQAVQNAGQRQIVLDAAKEAYGKKNYAEALKQFQSAEELGSVDAAVALGIMYSKGEGTAVDKQEALRWYLKAAEQNVAKAQFNCGVMYDTGEGTTVDKQEALRWYLKAAKQGVAKAQFNCGNMYFKGEGTAVDKQEALPWFLKAAEQGHADAQFNCGVMYNTGEGTAEDKQEALRWYLKAAEQGVASAQFSCSGMYFKGEGTAVDKQEALRWLLKAAEQGHANAQFICGAMYFQGEGTNKNRAKAKTWFQKAAAQGNEEAKRILREQF